MDRPLRPHSALVILTLLTACQSPLIRSATPHKNDVAVQLESKGARVETKHGEVVGVYFFNCHRPVDDADLRLLAQCPQLREVWLHGTQVTDAGLLTLADCPRLQRLELPISPQFSVTSVAELQRRLPACRVERIGTGHLGTDTNDGW